MLVLHKTRGQNPLNTIKKYFLIELKKKYSYYC